MKLMSATYNISRISSPTINAIGELRVNALPLYNLFQNGGKASAQIIHELTNFLGSSGPTMDVSAQETNGGSPIFEFSVLFEADPLKNGVEALIRNIFLKVIEVKTIELDISQNVEYIGMSFFMKKEAIFPALADLLRMDGIISVDTSLNTLKVTYSPYTFSTDIETIVSAKLEELSKSVIL